MPASHDSAGSFTSLGSDVGPFGVPGSLAGKTGNSAVFDGAELGLKLSTSGSDLHDYQTLSSSFSGNEPANAWAVDGRYVDLESAMDLSSASSLQNPFDGGGSIAAAPLFLANLDFGQQGTFVQWGLVTLPVPEPSTTVLTFLGGLLLGMRFLPRRKGE